MNVRKITFIIIVSALLLSACGSQALPPAVTAAQKAVANTLGLQQDKVVVGSYEVKEWPNSCMGAAKEGEMCAQVITNGYKVTMRAQTDGKYYVAHTNQDGSLIRILP